MIDIGKDIRDKVRNNIEAKVWTQAKAAKGEHSVWSNVLFSVEHKVWRDVSHLIEQKAKEL